jgi:hypothetical protein
MILILEDNPSEVGAGDNTMPLVQLVGHDRRGNSMQGQTRTIRLLLGAMMVMVALVILSPTVSHADQQDRPFAREFRHSKQHHKHQVPEPRTDALLLGGIGFAASWALRRRWQVG